MKKRILVAATIAALGLTLKPLVGLAREPLADPAVELDADRTPRRRTGGNVLVAGGTLVSPTGPRQENVDVLIRAGKIVAIGRSLQAEPGIARIDASGLFIVPGAVDCHSHVAIEGGVNEMTEKLSSEVRIADVLDAKDVSVYRALAGGTTSAHVLHGSGNPIGGQDATIKLKWNRPASELPIPGAPRGIKFALGENPTRMEFFPRTRMGMEATYRRAFTEGRLYAEEWKRYEDAKKRGEDPAPPRRDLRLEALAGVLDGSIRVHCHCYRADEIVAFLKVCDEFGVKVATLQHVLEGYKVAHEIAKHGAGASTFSDWWAYKIEAFDAVPGNAGILTRAGVLTSINSDSGELIRHLFLEAAKSVRYGGLSEQEALALVTINPAKQLGVESKIGSLEVGKDGDLALWTAHPLSAFARPVLTLVDGEVFFERERTPAPDLPDPSAFTVAPDPGPTPPPPVSASGTYAIVNARVEPVSGPVLDRATVVVKDGRILAVGKDARVPEDATVIDGKGLWITPGFIEAGSWLGMVEIDSLKVTKDDRDSGDFQPDLVALAGVNPASEHVLVTRCAGITTSLATPEGGLVPGQASLVRLDGWTADEMSIAPRAALVVNFPGRPAPKDPEGGARPRRHDRLEVLERLFENAKHDLERRASSGANGARIPPEPKLEALAPYLRGERPVLFDCEDARTILDAVRFAEERGLRPVILNGRDAWKVASVLAEKKVPVLYGPVLREPANDHDPYDCTYASPALLDRAGVTVAIRSGGSQLAGPRNLPFEAAAAAAYGLGRTKALAAITRVPAELLGIAKERGTIAPGKVADLVVSLGDPLEPTARVRYVFIDGKPVSLESKQTRLEKAAKERLEAVRRRR